MKLMNTYFCKYRKKLINYFARSCYEYPVFELQIQSHSGDYGIGTRAMLRSVGGNSLVLRHELHHTEQADHVELHISQDRPRPLSQYMLQRDPHENQSYIADIQPRHEEDQEALLYIAQEPSGNRYR